MHGYDEDHRSITPSAEPEPRLKLQSGFGKEDQDSAPAVATAKHAPCCWCAKRRLGIRDRDRPLPSSQLLARSLALTGIGGDVPPFVAPIPM